MIDESILVTYKIIRLLTFVLDLWHMKFGTNDRIWVVNIDLFFLIGYGTDLLNVTSIKSGVCVKFSGLHGSLKGIVVIDYLDFSYLINGYYVAADFYYKLYCKSMLYRIRQFVAIKIWRKNHALFGVHFFHKKLL